MVGQKAIDIGKAAQMAIRQEWCTSEPEKYPESSKDRFNLLTFLYTISPRTKSLILATATPVQLYPVEAWDLLNAISIGNESVLGNDFSNWRKTGEALSLIMGYRNMPDDDLEAWAWIRNPF